MSSTGYLVRTLTTSQRALAIAVVIAQAGIAVTGSIVRVTGSGLGCPTWPQCVAGSLTPVAHPAIAPLHQWIEFGNRTLTGLVGIIAGLCVLAAWLIKPRRRRVLLLAGIQLGGVALQAVIGGITVLTGLLWWTVSVHFLVSMVLVWCAMLLVKSVNDGDAATRSLVSRPVRSLQIAQVIVLSALLMAGTFVTAAGPHAGDLATPRLKISVDVLAQIHADLLFIFLGMLIALGFAIRTADVTQRRAYWFLLLAVICQGTIGLVQYWTGVPEILVSIHVLGAAVVVIATAHLWNSSHSRLDQRGGEGLRSHNAEISVSSQV